MRTWLLIALCSASCATPAPSTGLAPPVPSAPVTTKGSVRPVPVFLAPGGAQPPSDGCPRATLPFRQPLVVMNDLDLPRYPPVLGFPIAFPRGAQLQSLNGFSAITLDGEPLTSQLETLSRWGDGPGACKAPIRWAYGFALAEVPPKSRAYLGLEHQPKQSRPSPLALHVDENADRIVVDTGAARFTLRKDWFNGLALVEVKRDGAFVPLAETPATADSGFLVQVGDQLASPLNGGPSQVVVERQGPAVATIAVRGLYALPKEPPLFHYVARFSFYAGTGAVLLEHTYYYGETQSISAEGAKNLRTTDRVYWRIPLRLGPAPTVTVRAHEQVHTLTPKDRVSLEQDKRSPDRPATVFAVSEGAQRLELGTIADQPFLAARGPAGYAVATSGWLGFRDPAALRYDPKAGALEVDFQSEAMTIGGARGIWSKVVLDFGAAADTDLAQRGSQLYAHATRPLIAVPNLAYLNTTHAYALLPERQGEGAYGKLDRDVDRLHAGTVEYLRKYRITGSQLWPDLPRSSCSIDGTCARFEEGYFEGGDNNYWDWSLVELEQFFRSADPAFIHDFAYPEAITMAETISFRPRRGTPSYDSSFAGLSPCYGPGRSFEGAWQEGLNHRTGNCPGDYGYNKVHRLAYLLTADRRFLDLFEDGAHTTIKLYGEVPKERPPIWLELSATRASAQYLEPILTAAEFSRQGDDYNRKMLKIAVNYFDFMKRNAFERGHACSYNGTGKASPRIAGECVSIQQWMMPIWVDWISRLSYLADLPEAKAWLLDWARTSLRRTTVLDAEGAPDLAALRASSEVDAENGWRTMYYCKANASGIQDETCHKLIDGENQNYYYANGLVAYLNTFGVVAEVDEAQALGLCRWLPKVWAEAVGRLDDSQLNDYVWGKSPGQAYAFAQRALAAIQRCQDAAQAAP